MEEDFKIQTDIFEGPLELLLHLIEKRKLHINDVSLVAVTDEFLSYVEREGYFSVSKSANFIWVASTLLLIKSRSLLPALSLTDEEEGDIRNLEERLKLYKEVKKLSPHIFHTFGERILFSKQHSSAIKSVFAPDKSCTTALLYTHMEALIRNFPRREKVPEVLVEKVISLEEMVERLSERIAGSLSLSFQDFATLKETKKKEQKVTVIVSFLAMLELVKRGILDVRQETQFGDITMESDQVGIPRYN